MIRFSIVIPVYNIAPYLRECLDSVVNQICPDWEAVCVDDGSTDGSGNILDEYAARDARFRVVHQQNKGVSAARNAALDIISGEWFLFLDADDVLGEFALSLIERITKGTAEKIDLIRYNLFSFAKKLDRTKFSKKCAREKVLDVSSSIRNDHSNSSFVCWAYRRAMFGSLRFKRYVHGEDRLFLGLVLSRANIVCDSGLNLYAYRHRLGSAMRTPMTKRKLSDRIGYALDWIDVLQASSKNVDARIYRMIVLHLTEGFVYGLYTLTGEDRRSLWQDWYGCLVCLDRRQVAVGWLKYVIKLNLWLRMRVVAWLLCAVPHWLKSKGLHR